MNDFSTLLHPNLTQSKVAAAGVDGNKPAAGGGCLDMPGDLRRCGRDRLDVQRDVHRNADAKTPARRLAANWHLAEHQPVGSLDLFRWNALATAMRTSCCSPAGKLEDRGIDDQFARFAARLLAVLRPRIRTHLNHDLIGAGIRDDYRAGLLTGRDRQAERRESETCRRRL